MTSPFVQEASLAKWISGQNKNVPAVVLLPKAALKALYQIFFVYKQWKRELKFQSDFIANFYSTFITSQFFTEMIDLTINKQCFLINAQHTKVFFHKCVFFYTEVQNRFYDTARKQSGVGPEYGITIS